MRGFLVFVGVVAILVGVFGYWRGWFTIHEDRIREDAKKAIEKVEGVRDKVLRTDE